MNSLSTSVRNLSVLWRHVHSATSMPIQRKEPKTVSSLPLIRC